MLEVNEKTVTDAVLESLKDTPDDRLMTIMTALIKHLHGFVRDIEPTEAEWMQAIEFLTATGQMCSNIRQEYILLSDTLGVTTLVDAINHRYPSGATSNSVLGPFFFEGRETMENGADIGGKAIGLPLYFQGQVQDVDGNPVADAQVDIWHSDADGHYDMMLPGFEAGETAMRAMLRTEADGSFWFRSIMPTSYPIPDDGPVGAMMRATRRSNMRPGHVHFVINAPGYERLTTMVFVDGDDHLSADPVFGVKAELIQDFVHCDSGTLPDGSRSATPFAQSGFTFTMAPVQKAKG
ncbi:MULTISPECIES: dioxygenase [unclassified Sphingobium]|uniref:dioxygenase family protein n=1 Tax=unclassified Sphingobium TaxID=2611147 RepID=UPI0035A6E11C